MLRMLAWTLHRFLPPQLSHTKLMIIMLLLLDIGKEWRLRLWMWIASCFILTRSVPLLRILGYIFWLLTILNVIDDALVNIDGYSIKRCDSNRNGGGIALYINDSTVDKCSIRVNLPESLLESWCLEVKPSRAAPFLVIPWYRPPNGCADIFRQLEESM